MKPPALTILSTRSQARYSAGFVPVWAGRLELSLKGAPERSKGSASDRPHSGPSPLHPATSATQVSFSESGSLGNSSSSDVTSLSSQLPDTPNSMVPSPVET